MDHLQDDDNSSSKMKSSYAIPLFKQANKQHQTMLGCSRALLNLIVVVIVSVTTISFSPSSGLLRAQLSEETLNALVHKNRESSEKIRQMEGLLEQLQSNSTLLGQKSQNEEELKLLLHSQRVGRADQIANIREVVHCEGPSLPVNAFHIIVGGYARKEAGMDIVENYLWNLGLTNAEVFWYRRVEPEVPLRSLNGPCGVRLHERLLYPNYGVDASALFDYILEHYDHPPPKGVMFLHGHGARGWHTSCDAVFARSVYYYRNLATPPNTNSTIEYHQRQAEILRSHHGAPSDIAPNSTASDNETSPVWVGNHMMTLTSNKNGTKTYMHRWAGHSAGQPGVGLLRVVDLKASRASGKKIRHGECDTFLLRWRPLILKYSSKKFSRKAKPFHSCCASFIVPGDRFRRYPKAFYEEIQALHMSRNDSKAVGYAYDCFEYIIYALFGDDESTEEEDSPEAASNRTETIKRFYDEADSLIHGSSRIPQSTINENWEGKTADASVLERAATCKQWNGVKHE